MQSKKFAQLELITTKLEHLTATPEDDDIWRDALQLGSVPLLSDVVIFWCPIVVKLKVKQSHYRPRGFQEVEVPRFQDNRHMKVARLSALRTGRFLPPENIPGTHFC